MDHRMRREAINQLQLSKGSSKLRIMLLITADRANQQLERSMNVKYPCEVYERFAVGNRQTLGHSRSRPSNENIMAPRLQRRPNCDTQYKYFTAVCQQTNTEVIKQCIAKAAKNLLEKHAASHRTIIKVI
jgi:hypothetical protein